VLYFQADGTPIVEPLRDARFRTSNLQPLRAMLRIALRPVFEQLYETWTPPPVPLLLAFPSVAMLGIVAVFLWMFVLGAQFVILAVSDGNADSLIGALILFACWTGSAIWALWKALPMFRRLGGAITQFRRPSAEHAPPPIDPSMAAFFRRTMDAWAGRRLPCFTDIHEREGQISYARFVQNYAPEKGGALSVLSAAFPPRDDEYLIGYGDQDSGRNRAWFVLTNQRLLQKDGRSKTFCEVILSDVDSFTLRGTWTMDLAFTMTSGERLELRRLEMCPKEEFLAAAIGAARPSFDALSSQ